MLAGIVLLGGICALLFAFAPPKEPLHEGKGLAEWLAMLDDDGGRNPGISFESLRPQIPERARVAEKVREIGPDALPYLLWMLRASDEPLIVDALRLPPVLALAKRITPLRNYLDRVARESSSDGTRAWRAALGIEALGEMATNTIPELLELMTKVPVGSQLMSRAKASARALGGLGKPGALALTSCITNSNNLSAPIAIWAAGQRSIDDPAAISALIQSLASTNQSMHGIAAWALGRTAKMPSAVVPLLVRGLNNPQDVPDGCI